MATGLETSQGWVNAPTDLPGFGDIQWEGAGGGWGRGQGGGDWPEIGATAAQAYSGENTGFERLATGLDITEPVPGAAGNQTTDWRFLFNWQHNPMFWVLLAGLAAVGFIHARLSLRAGPARVGGGLG